MANQQGILRWLSSAFTQNLGLKSLALLFSLGFFIYLHSQEQPIRKTLPVSLTSVPPNDGSKQLMTQIPASLRITISGSARKIDQLLATGIPPAEVDLEGYPENIEFTRKMFTLPDGLELNLVDPPRLGLQWEPVILRQIPLQPSLSGQPADGFIIKGKPVVEPRRVTVRGPVSKVEVMQYARLAPFDVSGLAENSWSRRIAIDPPPAGVNFVGTPAATVTVEVQKRTQARLFKDRLVQVVGSAKAHALPLHVDITVVGEPEVVSALREEQVIALADLSQVKDYDADSPGHGSARVAISVDLAKVQFEAQPPFVTVKW